MEKFAWNGENLSQVFVFVRWKNGWFFGGFLPPGCFSRSNFLVVALDCWQAGLSGDAQVRTVRNSAEKKISCFFEFLK